MSESTPPPAPGTTDATPTPAGEVRNFPGEWAQKKGTPLGWYYAARSQEQWQAGVSLVTEAEFDAAVESVQDMQINSIHGPHVRAGEETK